MQFQIFSKAIQGLPAEFNPYFSCGTFELCVDRDGWRVWFRGRTCGRTWRFARS